MISYTFSDGWKTATSLGETGDIARREKETRSVLNVRLYKKHDFKKKNYKTILFLYF